MKSEILHACLKADEIERLILSRPEDPLTSQRIGDCNRCRKRYSEIEQFYQILLKELSKPISARIKNLVRRLLRGTIGMRKVA